MEPHKQRLFDQLAQRHWACSDDVIDPMLHERLYQYCDLAWAAGRFQPARVGHEHSPAAAVSIRGDAISWLDDTDAGSCASEFLTWARQLRRELNAVFYTGLRSEEFHFARYEAGHGYTTHMDQHRGNPHRQISLVLYLNRSWSAQDGGELCLYSPEDQSHEIHRILPQPGRLVLFRSDVFPHAVLPCHKPRLSVSGWFRTDQPL